MEGPPADAEEPTELCQTVKSKDRDGSDNANSVAVVLNFGGFRFFDAGDLTWNQETKLICPKNLIGKVDEIRVYSRSLSDTEVQALASQDPLRSVLAVRAEERTDEQKQQLRQYFLERSNVEVVTELISLITAQRAYEINSRAIRAGDEMLSTTSDIVR